MRGVGNPYSAYITPFDLGLDIPMPGFWLVSSPLLDMSYANPSYEMFTSLLDSCLAPEIRCCIRCFFNGPCGMVLVLRKQVPLHGECNHGVGGRRQLAVIVRA